MIPQNLQITLCIAVVCYFIIILHYLKNKMLELKYSLIWLVAGVVLGIFVFFPQLLNAFIHLLGIESLMNGLFILCIAFIIILLMMLTSIVSRTTMKMRTMVQKVAILEKRIRELEKISEKEEN